MPPPPCRGSGAAPRACAVLASCLQHACNEGKTTRPPPSPHTSAPQRVQEDGRKGRTAPPPPPEDKAARWGGSGERVWDGPHDRARRKHAPCKPQRGGHRGCERRVGRATTGATRQAPPPAGGQVPRLVPVPCLRRAYARGRTSRAPPPPTPSPPPTQERGGDSEEVRRGHLGGAEDRPTCQEERRAASGGDAKKKENKKKNNGQSKPSRPGKKARRQGPKTRRTGGGRGDMGPQGTLMKYPTPGVWGAQRGKPPPPTAATPCACVVLASCL